MIAQTLLYKKLAKFTCPPAEKHRPIFNCLFFDGEQVIACDTHWIAMVKDYKAEPHLETIEGKISDLEVEKYPDYHRILLKEEHIRWKHKIKFGILNDLRLDRWKQLLDFLKKAIKDKTKADYLPVALRKAGSRMFLYASGPVFSMKFDLCSNLDDKDLNWIVYFNVEYLLKTIDFLKATDPAEMEISIGDYNPISQCPMINFETEDLRLQGTSLNYIASTDPDTVRLRSYIESELAREKQPDLKVAASKEPDDIDDMDFLN